jgi:hypothetical protein
MNKIMTLTLVWALQLLAQNNFQTAVQCGECHQEIYQEWKTSMHAKATSLQDPLFKGMYNWGIEDTNGKLKPKCIVCHSPMSNVFKNISMDETYNQEGVTCQFCHGTSHINGFKSAKNMQIKLDTIYSHQPQPKNPEHPVANREFFIKSELCLPCHAIMKNPKDLEVCATGSEWQAFHAKTGKNCQDCHMPKLNGSPSHLFAGTHQNDLLVNSVEMDLSFDENSRDLKVVLTNGGAGHAIPTGTPLRMVMLKVSAYDSSGNLIWQNWKENPVEEDRLALFMKIMADDQGNSPVPPWRATRTIFEKRLMPGEPTVISYKLKVENIYDLEANLLYRFAPSFILQKFKISDPHFTEARLIVQKGIKLAR